MTKTYSVRTVRIVLYGPIEIESKTKQTNKQTNKQFHGKNRELDIFCRRRLSHVCFLAFEYTKALRCAALRRLTTHTTPTTTANNDAAALLQLFVGFVITAHLYLCAFEACSLLVHNFFSHI